MIFQNCSQSLSNTCMVIQNFSKHYSKYLNANIRIGCTGHITQALSFSSKVHSSGDVWVSPWVNREKLPGECRVGHGVGATREAHEQCSSHTTSVNLISVPSIHPRPTIRPHSDPRMIHISLAVSMLANQLINLIHKIAPHHSYSTGVTVSRLSPEGTLDHLWQFAVPLLLAWFFFFSWNMLEFCV